jgi:transposase-like protein
MHDALEELRKKWNDKYPMIYQSWQRHWDDLSEFYKYPPEIRRTLGSQAIYTTNAIESLNFSLCKVIKNKLIFVNDEAIFKILYLAIRNACESGLKSEWTMPIRDWGRALNQFAIEFGKERVPF